MKKSGKAVQSTERVLKIDRLFTEGIILDSTDEIEDSLMYREYCQAGKWFARLSKGMNNFFHRKARGGREDLGIQEWKILFPLLGNGAWGKPQS